MRHPEAEHTDVLLIYRAPDTRRRIYSATLQGKRSSQAVLDSPMVLRSRSFGFAETVSECVAVHVTCLRMARRGGDEWLTRERVVVDTATQETL